MANAEGSTSLPVISRRRLLWSTAAVPVAWLLQPSGAKSGEGMLVEPGCREWHRLQMVLNLVAAERDDLEARVLGGGATTEELARVEDRIDELFDRQERLLGEICASPVASITDVAAKLLVIVLRGQPSPTTGEFPWPALRGLFDDLRLLAREA